MKEKDKKTISIVCLIAGFISVPLKLGRIKN